MDYNELVSIERNSVQIQSASILEVLSNEPNRRKNLTDAERNALEESANGAKYLRVDNGDIILLNSIRVLIHPPILLVPHSGYDMQTGKLLCDVEGRTS